MKPLQILIPIFIFCLLCSCHEPANRITIENKSSDTVQLYFSPFDSWMATNNPEAVVEDTILHKTHFQLRPGGSFFLGISTGEIDTVDIGFNKLTAVKGRDTMLHATSIDSIMKLFTRNADGSYATPFRIELK